MKPIVWPKWNDTRILILLFFAILAYAILGTPGFARTWRQFAVASGICLSLDLILGYVFARKWIFPLSGIVSSFGVAVLVDSPALWPTAVAAVLASLSKHLVRWDGRHVFNPNNFGVVVTVLAFPDWAVTGAMRWGGKLGLSFLLFGIGWLIVYRADRWAASLSYMLGFLFFNALRSLIFEKPIWAYSISLLGPAMQLFIFYMISDPKTSPSARRNQMAYGIAIAALDNLMRHMQIKDAPLFALFLVTFGYAVLRQLGPLRLHRQDQARMT